ncbi:MAG: dockerin type I repeat-containing protein, partial [Dehalococcoidia bacterium]
SWTDVSGNLSDAPANVIRIVGSTLYSGTDVGAFQSTDGENWTPLGVGLPNAPVTDLIYQGGTGRLFALTFGRGAWSLPLACVLGDVNCDRHVNAVDALCLLRAVAGLSGTTACPAISLHGGSSADINQDGAVTVLDALCILRSVAGLAATVACPKIPIPADDQRR